MKLPNDGAITETDQRLELIERRLADAEKAAEFWLNRDSVLHNFFRAEIRWLLETVRERAT